MGRVKNFLRSAIVGPDCRTVSEHGTRGPGIKSSTMLFPARLTRPSEFARFCQRILPNCPQRTDYGPSRTTARTAEHLERSPSKRIPGSRVRKWKATTAHLGMHRGSRIHPRRASGNHHERQPTAAWLPRLGSNRSCQSMGTERPRRKIQAVFRSTRQGS